MGWITLELKRWIEVGDEGHRRVATIKTGISVACTCEMRALRSIWGADGRRREGATSNQLRSLEYDSASIDVSRAIFIRNVELCLAP